MDHRSTSESIEIIESILKPSHPFETHTARHVYHSCYSESRGQYPSLIMTSNKRGLKKAT
jgi:hypothetical protein